MSMADGTTSTEALPCFDREISHAQCICVANFIRLHPIDLELLTRGLMGLWIFHHLMGGVETPPSNSAPRRRSEKPKNGFESSSEINTKVLQHFFTKVNIEVTRGHQMSNLAKFHFYSEMGHHLRKYFS